MVFCIIFFLALIDSLHQIHHCSADFINKAQTVTWSNRQGLTLTPVATGLWSADRSFMWNNINVGGRMAVARMNDGSLLVHSPVEWTKELGDCLEQLGGGVGHVLIPNFEHLKYSKQWKEIYKDASFWRNPGLDLFDASYKEWTKELKPDSSIIADGSIDFIFFDFEQNPFNSKPFFNELVFHHSKSKSFIVTDAYWNYPEGTRPNYGRECLKAHQCPKMPSADVNLLPEVDVPYGTKCWKWGMDTVYAPFYKNFMVGKKGPRRERYNTAISKLLDWKCEVIVPCHGDIVRGTVLCREVLTKHFLN